jgi:hypothetical protein
MSALLHGSERNLVLKEKFMAEVSDLVVIRIRVLNRSLDRPTSRLEGDGYPRFEQGSNQGEDDGKGEYAF